MGKKQRKRESTAVKQGTELKQSELRALSVEELARQAKQGCEVSFAELVERYGARLFHFLYHKTGNVQDAEDLVQDTFVKAYQNIHRYSNSWKFSTWLFTIAKRLASSYYRRLRRSQTIAKVEAGVPEPGEIVTQEESRQSLWATARDLSRNQYQALWLKYAEDMSIKEIARVMIKSQVNVKVLLYRARINLAERLRNVAAEDEAVEQMSSKEALSFMKVEGA
jgi:RNA polymerase sigma-70 factor (ECF subfamily)